MAATDSIELIKRRVEEVRQVTLGLVADLGDAQLELPYSATVNPMRWELGHMGFFYDCFVLTELDGGPPLFRGGRDFFDSFEVDHADRWDLALPNRTEVLDYLTQVNARLIGRLVGASLEDREVYLYELATRHESMHDEAFCWTRQTMGYCAPKLGPGTQSQDRAGAHAGDVRVEPGEFSLGANPKQGFVFDNEKWAHPVDLRPFTIARAPVTNGEFAAFVDAGGYRKREYWSTSGWIWRGKAKAEHPNYWRNAKGGWEQRSFDVSAPLKENAPVVHIGWYEAEAYCRWAGRRLPTEAEWECAASTAPDTAGKRLYPWGDEPMAAGDDRANLDFNSVGCVDVGAYSQGDSGWGCRQMLGNVWEWTSSAFYPYPGFVVDTPYREYSAPWFGYPKVLKGGAWATRSWLVTNTHRNFFEPGRRDVFAGFRTCAIDGEAT
ncbi:MAG: iron(II)-dependent oxidoreductase [Myxococcota bacterium]|jgi:iron(II)-dependent oxidoreductase